MDARKLTHEQLTELRKRGVSSVQNGEEPGTVARILGVSKMAVYNWLSLYRNGGWHALEAQKRGGRRPKLDAKALQWVYNLVTGGDPMQMKFPFALWTCQLIAKAIKMKFGISLSRWSVSRLLHQMGLSAQKPLHRAYQQNEKAVKEWKRKVYPDIRREAKKTGAEIYFLDESAVRSDYHSGTTWAPTGKTPVQRSTGARFSLNMIAAITNRGKMRFSTFKGSLTGEVFVDFMSRLIQDSDTVVFLIVDGHPVHRSRLVKEFVEGTGRIRLFQLPGYSPELNPVEQVWNHAKRHQVGKQVITGPEQLKKLVISALRKLQKLPHIIVAFFKHRECSYAN